jgi:hypothetical protein
MSEEWVPDAAPPVPPDSKFREELHRALEETHRRQIVERRTSARGARLRVANLRWWWLALVVTVAAVAGLVLWMRRRK